MRPHQPLLLGLAGAAAALALLPATSFAAANRTWVSGVGDDVNPCSRTAPCKTFAGAIAKTATNGEIDALDPGGFGAVTITHGITIDGGGMLASVLNSGTNGINVNAPGATVVLRHLSFNGTAGDGAPPACGASGLNAIRITAAANVVIEDSVITNESQTGIAVNPASGTTQVSLDGVTVQRVCGTGIDLAPSGTGAANVVLRNTRITAATTGLHAGARVHAWMTGSSIWGNGTGLLIDGGGILNAIDQNQVVDNGTNGTPSSATSSTPPAVVTTPGPTVTKTVTVPAAPQCVVPTLTGLSPSAAKAKLAKQHCALGSTKTKATKKRRTARRA